MQAALAHNPTVALAVTVYTLALPLFGGNPSDSCLQISLKALTPSILVTVADDCDGHSAMVAEAEMWGDRLPGDPADLFSWCLAQPQDLLLSLLAFCAASSLNAVKEKCDADTSPRLAHVEALAESLGLDMAAHWTPSVEGFYGKLTKAGLLMVAKEANATLALVIGNEKKAEAARHVMKAIAETGWIPAILASKNRVQGEESAVAEAA